MSGEPRLLLADEPTSQLDARNRDAVVRITAACRRDVAGPRWSWSRTIPAVADVMHRQVTLAEGRIVDIGHGRLR